MLNCELLQGWDRTSAFYQAPLAAASVHVTISPSHPSHPRGGHPPHSNLVHGKLTSPTPNPAGDRTYGFTSCPRRWWSFYTWVNKTYQGSGWPTRPCLQVLFCVFGCVVEAKSQTSTQNQHHGRKNCLGNLRSAHRKFTHFIAHFRAADQKFIPVVSCIFSIQLSRHFLRLWQGEFVQQSRSSLVGDHFHYSPDLNVWFRDDVVRRN